MDLHTHIVEFEGEEATRAHVLGADYVERRRLDVEPEEIREEAAAIIRAELA